MTLTTLNHDISEFQCVVTAMSNTWSNSRRKRRLQKRIQESCQAEQQASDEPAEKSSRTDEGCTSSPSVEANSEPLIVFSLELKLTGGAIELNTQLVEGKESDMLHQVLQYLKNRLV